MLNKSRLQWTPQEDQLLKYLREEEKIEKWNLIALKIKNISHYRRTSKQCRERYISNAKFFGQKEENASWTPKQQRLIFDLYLEHGPKWTYFIDKFELRSQNSIKNRFYNFMRKSLRKMNQANESRYPYSKKPLRIESIMVILELSKKIQNQSLDLIGYQIDSSTMDLLKIRNEIILAAIEGDTITRQQILTIVDNIHRTNCYLRHLGIFKAKSKKGWKLDKKRLEYIISMQGVEQFIKPELIQEEVKEPKIEVTTMEHIPYLISEEQDMIFSQQILNSSINIHEQCQSWTHSFNKQIFECLDELSPPQFAFDQFQ